MTRLPRVAMASRLERMNATTRTSVLSAASIGLLSLTGCAGGADTQAFCDFTATIEESFSAVETQPSQEALLAAQEGDFSEFNQWGEDAGANVQQLRDDLATAKDGAPDVASEQALALFQAATDTVYEVTQLAAEADDMETFFADADAQYVALEEELASVDEDPEITLARATEEHCDATQ